MTINSTEQKNSVFKPFQAVFWTKTNVMKLTFGTEGRIRTDTEFPQPDFESNASTNFATPAQNRKIKGFGGGCNKDLPERQAALPDEGYNFSDYG